MKKYLIVIPWLIFVFLLSLSIQGYKPFIIGVLAGALMITSFAMDIKSRKKKRRA